MKIVIINGSPRSDGATAAILHGIEKELRSLGVDVEFYDLGTLDMNQCKGCCACYRTGSCFMDDDAEKISRAIAEADGLILGSPTYAGNVSGLMKLLIDRGHFVIEQLLKGKYCVTVATGENYGSRDVGKILEKLVLYSGGQLSDRVVIDVPFNSIRTESPIGLSSASKLYRDISRKREHPTQILLHRIIFTFGIKPFVLKKGELYTGVTDRWREAGILMIL